jgi:hypothetical protein
MFFVKVWIKKPSKNEYGTAAQNRDMGVYL